jgi:hypothetical protein
LTLRPGPAVVEDTDSATSRGRAMHSENEADRRALNPAKLDAEDA